LFENLDVYNLDAGCYEKDMSFVNKQLRSFSTVCCRFVVFAFIKRRIAHDILIMTI